jgi:hypothetical protein
MSFKKYEEPSVDTEFKQKLDINYIVYNQILKCNNASTEGDEARFANGIEALLNMLPKENRARIESDKGREEYVETIEQFVYQFSCGHRMGSPEAPIYRNRKDLDWNYSPNINNGEPILVSPITETVEQTNYNKLYKIIMNELQDCGITWGVEPKGNVEKRIDPKPTPVFVEPTNVEEDVEEDVEDEI